MQIIQGGKSADKGLAHRNPVKAVESPNLPAALPAALHKAMRGLSLGDHFFEAGYRAAKQAGCKLLFEIPARLVEDAGERAAAIHYCRNGADVVLFLVARKQPGEIAIVFESEAPAGVADFTRSYAEVLGLIASDETLRQRIVH